MPGSAETTAAAKAALPVPTSVCSILVFRRATPWLSIAVKIGIFDVRIDVDACDSVHTRAVQRLQKTVNTES